MKMYNTTELKHCYILNQGVKVRTKETKRKKTKYNCQTARDGNILICRMMRCKIVNGGKGKDPFICDYLGTGI